MNYTNKAINYTSEMMTPREFSASRRGLPFGAYRDADAKAPAWEMVSGLVAAVGPGPSRYVQSCALFGVVWDKDEGYTIATYWTDKAADWIRRPYTLQTLRTYACTGRIYEQRRGLTYEVVMSYVAGQYPGIKIPSKREFFGQFGVPVEEVEDDEKE